MRGVPLLHSLLHSGRAAAAFLPLGALGCAPTVNVIGVYFPGWLVSAVAGVVLAYVAVSLLGRRSRTRELAQSGLLFCGLTVSIGLGLWWALFSGF